MGNSLNFQIAVLMLFLASGARADGPFGLHNYSADGTPAWADNPQFNDCGLKCLYLQSSEKISIKSRHTIETLNRMKAINATSSTDQKDQDVIKAQDQMNAIIPGVCEWGDGKESVKACQIRWFKVQLPTLYQDQLAINYNMSSAAELQTVTVPVLSGTTVPDLSQPVMPEKPQMFRSAVQSDFVLHQPIVTTMEQYDEIKARALRSANTDPYLRNVNRLSQDIERSVGVSREDFVQKRELLKDPNDPKAGTYTVVVTKPDGTPQYDMKAFQNEVLKRANLLVLSSDEKARLKKNFQNLADLHRAQLKTTESKSIYTAVRSSVLGTARKALEKDGLISRSVPKATPTPQAVKGPKPAAMTAAPAGRQGVSDASLSSTSGGNDQDIQVPAVTPDHIPYFTVHYSDAVIGNEIRKQENILGDLEKP